MSFTFLDQPHKETYFCQVQTHLKENLTISAFMTRAGSLVPCVYCVSVCCVSWWYPGLVLVYPGLVLVYPGLVLVYPGLGLVYAAMKQGNPGSRTVREAQHYRTAQFKTSVCRKVACQFLEIDCKCKLASASQSLNKRDGKWGTTEQAEYTFRPSSFHEDKNRIPFVHSQ